MMVREDLLDPRSIHLHFDERVVQHTTVVVRREIELDVRILGN